METTTVLMQLLTAAVGLRTGWVLRSSIRPMIEITAEPAAPIEVVLVGVDYKIQPPKSSLALKLAIRAKTAGEDPTLMLEAIDEWINKAFGKTNGAKIKKRLDDPDDLLDINHVMQLMEKIVEATTATPTT